MRELAAVEKTKDSYKIATTKSLLGGIADF
jgi:hypothetical protein